MTIEQETFVHYLILQDRLFSYGFQRNSGKLVYMKLLSKEDFQIILEYDGEIHGRIIDLDVVPLYKLDHMSNSREEVEVINGKVDSGKVEDMLAQKGYFRHFI